MSWKKNFFIIFFSLYVCVFEGSKEPTNIFPAKIVISDKEKKNHLGEFKSVDSFSVSTLESIGPE